MKSRQQLSKVQNALSSIDLCKRSGFASIEIGLQSLLLALKVKLRQFPHPGRQLRRQPKEPPRNDKEKKKMMITLPLMAMAELLNDLYPSRLFQVVRD